ncbi:hypothetical protein pb186bvf_013300 [Paramecium bursaria]
MQRKVRASSPKPTEEQVQKLKLAQQGIKKRNSKLGFFDIYKIHIIVAIAIGFIIIVALSLLKPKQLNLVIDDEEIQQHNSNKYPFTLGRNEFFQNFTLTDAKYLFQNYLTLNSSLPKCPKLNTNIPSVFNFYDAYPRCKNRVYDQGNCSSSYAVAIASAFSDRICQENEIEQLSPQNLLSCEGRNNMGCKGGYMTKSIDYIINHGLTTLACQPFQGVEVYQDCQKLNCTRYKAKEYCQIQTKDDIKREILTYGPVVSMISPYRDFLIYQDGIYQVLEGTKRYSGHHVVKIIGWGDQDGYQYWIIENSWGESWGQNGYAKVAMDGFLDLSERALSILI